MEAGGEDSRVGEEEEEEKMEMFDGRGRERTGGGDRGQCKVRKGGDEFEREDDLRMEMFER